MSARPFPSPSRKGKKVGEAQTKAGTPTLNWLERRKMTRQMDLTRKKQARVETRALLRTLWELEAEARGQKEAVRSKDIQLHLVLEKLVMRVRSMTGRQPRVFPAYFGTPGFPYNQGASAYLGDPQELSREDVDVTAGLAGSHSLGMLYVCVEDWVVRRSNRAMELVCPFEMLRGYVGMEFPGVVHPDDHLQLALLQQEQAAGFRPGDSLVLSVRMLRACQDGGTLVMGWRRQILEVAHVTKDEEHGGKLHVMFTCVLEADSLQPLTLDPSDRRAFQDTAQAVSGSMVMDPLRTTESMATISKFMSDAGLKDRTDTSPVADFLSGISRSVGRSLGIPQLLSFVENLTRSALNNFVRTHVLLGLAPDGTPWLQKSSALSAFGFTSQYHTFISLSMSGRAGTATMPGMDSPDVVCGILKSHDCSNAMGGGDAVGFVILGLAKGPRTGQEETRKILFVAQDLFLWDAQARLANERTVLTFYQKHRDGTFPQKDEVNCMRIAPPDPVLLERFLKFGTEGLEHMGLPFPELLR